MTYDPFNKFLYLKENIDLDSIPTHGESSELNPEEEGVKLGDPIFPVDPDSLTGHALAAVKQGYFYETESDRVRAVPEIYNQEAEWYWKEVASRKRERDQAEMGGRDLAHEQDMKALMAQQLRDNIGEDDFRVEETAPFEFEQHDDYDKDDWGL